MYRSGFEALFHNMPGLRSWWVRGDGSAQLRWDHDEVDSEEEEASGMKKNKRKREDDSDGGDAIARRAMLAVMEADRRAADKEQEEKGEDEWEKLLNM